MHAEAEHTTGGAPSLPNLIIAGIPKAATSSLFRWLSGHPNVLGSSIKETCYFVDEDAHNFNPSANFSKHGLDGYRQFFVARSGCPAPRLTIEATPTYVYQRQALAHLPDLPSRPTFIFTLRRPSMQLYSVYRYFSNNHISMDRSITFPQFVDLARKHDDALSRNELLRFAHDNCKYLTHLRKWRERAGADRIKLLLFEELVADPRAALQSLARDLQIDPSFYDSYGFPTYNETYRVRNAILHRIVQKVRTKIPKGAVYSKLRSTYRGLNTDRGEHLMAAEDRKTIAMLDQEFAECNRQLASEFGLNLGRWTQ